MDEEKVAISEVEVLARKVDLERQLQSAQSMVAALSGAIQDCDWWLAKLAAKEEEKRQVAMQEAAKKKKRKK